MNIMELIKTRESVKGDERLPASELFFERTFPIRFGHRHR